MKAAGVLALGLAMVLLAGCGESDTVVAQGYVEGDFHFIGPDADGRIADVMVEEGDQVVEGAPLFRLDTQVEEAELAAAQARVREAQARLEDLLRGARPPRLAALQAAVEKAEAEMRLASKRLARRLEMRDSPAVSPEDIDEAEAAHEAAEASVAQANQELALEALPARENEIEAARGALAAAEAEMVRLERLIARHEVAAPMAGLVQELVRRSGETVRQGAAVISFLPQDGRRAIFFVPQEAAPSLRRGQNVAVLCDGCPDDLTGIIRFVASEVEFTPPVILGPQERRRLLVRVEAQLAADTAPALKPGQPISVRLTSTEADDG